MKKILILFIALCSVFESMVTAQFVFKKDPTYSFADLTGGFISPAVDLLQDGSMYLGLGYLSGSYRTNTLSRYKPNGQLDSNLNGNYFENNISIISAKNGNIMVVLDNRIVRKLNDSGIQDNSFGNNGVLNFGYNSSFFFNTDNSFYVKDGDIISKFNAAGVLQNSFTVDSNSWINNVGDNTLFLISRASDPNFMNIKKLDGNGTIDTSFGNGGQIITLFSLNIKISDDDETFVTIDNPNNTLGKNIYKYKKTGELDQGFGNGGLIEIIIPNRYTDNPSIANTTGNLIIDSNKNLTFVYTVLKYSSIPRPILLDNYFIRFTENGQKDNTFNNGSAEYIGKHKFIRKCRMINDNKIFCSGYYQPTLNVEFGAEKFIRSEILATNELNERKISIYPNPVTNNLNLKLKIGESLKEINIYSMEGRLILSSKKLKVDVSTLEKGNYIAEVKTNKSIFKKKIIKK